MWKIVLVSALGTNAALGVGYRVYRLAKAGPLADVVGQAILATLLVAIAAGVAAEWGWARWAAVVYGAAFAVVVMPIWTLAVLIPLRPAAVDYVFTVAYWTLLVVIVIAAVAA